VSDEQVTRAAHLERAARDSMMSITPRDDTTARETFFSKRADFGCINQGVAYHFAQLV
jgi:hypothetical protein